ncbi:MAG: hypothetical protein LBB89_00360 [Treponema sp.]|nr:hypothetical protein [Treponema sp.]
MKNCTKLFGTIALMAIIGFSFTACGGGDDDGGGGGGDGSLGATLTITNAQVYNLTDEGKVGTPYNGTIENLNHTRDFTIDKVPIKPLGDLISGSPSVTLISGKLSISLGTPKSTALMDGDDFAGEGVTISTSGAKYFALDWGFYDGTGDSASNWVFQMMENSKNHYGAVYYIYVDKNIKITGTFVDVDEEDDDGEYTTKTVYKMDLKTGWNSVIVEETATGKDSSTFTMKTAKPTANHKWVITDME